MLKLSFMLTAGHVFNCEMMHDSLGLKITKGTDLYKDDAKGKLNRHYICIKLKMETKLEKNERGRITGLV